MPYAVFVHVKLDPVSGAEHRLAILRDFASPEVRALAGFRNAMWMNDGGGSGACLVVFDTRAHADRALGSLTRPDGPPVIGSAVYEVELEI
jgi:hypothetical protein